MEKPCGTLEEGSSLHVLVPSMERKHLSSPNPNFIFNKDDPFHFQKFNNPFVPIKISEIEDAANIIKTAWLACRDRRIFKMLKHAICAAENCMTESFLRKISPREAELLQDPAFPARVRLRFGGSSFPPMIFFKIFHHHNGPGVKYICGKEMIRASTEATGDSLKMMGSRIFYDNLLQDSLQEHPNRITDEINILTLKDYMQYLANLDETPAKYGGKSNFWRLLTLDDVPRHTIFFDIVEFLYSGKLSRNLRQQLPGLLLKPITTEIQLQHLKIISLQRHSTQLSYPIPSKILSNIPNTKRRSKQAIQRVSKMKLIYKSQKEEYFQNKEDMEPQYGSEMFMDQPTEISKENSYSLPLRDRQLLNSLSAAVLDECNLNGWDNEAYQLYKWSQHLSVDNLSPPKLPT